MAWAHQPFCTLLEMSRTESRMFILLHQSGRDSACPSLPAQILPVLWGLHHSANTDLVVEVLAVVPHLTHKEDTLRSARSEALSLTGMMTP